MKIELLQKNMYVYIDHYCRTTKIEYGVIGGMIEFMGTVQKIQKIFIRSVKIGGYSWSPKDLSIPKIEKYIVEKSTTPILFNPKELIL